MYSWRLPRSLYSQFVHRVLECDDEVTGLTAVIDVEYV